MLQFYVEAIYFLIMHLFELIAILIKIIANTLKCFDLMNGKQMIWKFWFCCLPVVTTSTIFPFSQKNFNFIKSAFFKVKNK